MLVIELQDVEKYYPMGESLVKALDGISMKIEKGDFAAIMGPSGSGKSTSMNLVGSLDLPTRGTIFLEGEDIAEFNESELAQIRGRKIGFIFQSFNLISNLTVKENVMLPLLFQRVSAEDREERAEKLLALVDLSNRSDHYPSQISGGQQQRAAIARALANDPEVILADEPTGNLDTKTGDTVMNLLKKLNEDGKTIIMVTHDPELAQKHARKIYWMRDGKIEKITFKINNKWGTKK
ncbi:MAG TPA: ABC transporter ATP-binding protein [Candidatus Nanoarchaeia archaeon]|nr:ABC transporter ATP-binding protein [Candidatus Nanoarchaeia archaeon]